MRDKQLLSQLRGKSLSLCRWVAFQLWNGLGCMESVQMPRIQESCGFWGLKSRLPQRTRTGPRINSYFIGHQFKVTLSDSLGCRGRARGLCNEIHAASPYLKPALTSWIHLSSRLTHTSHLPLHCCMEAHVANRNANKYLLKLCQYSWWEHEEIVSGLWSSWIHS